MTPKFQSIVFLAIVLITEQSVAFIRLCYFPEWAFDRETISARFDVLNLEADICTHLVFAFGNVNVTGLSLRAPSAGDERFKYFNALKTVNPQLKTLLSLGGQTDTGEGFLAVSKEDSKADTFAANTVSFLRQHNFNGLDIDWEYPNKTTSQYLLRLLKSLRRAFDQGPQLLHLLLSIAVPAGQQHISGFNIPEINRYVDYVSIMTYDFVDARYSEVTNFNSPLFSNTDPFFNEEYSTNWTVGFYSRQGLSLNKTLFGVTGAGKRLVLNDTTKHELGSPIKKGILRYSLEYKIHGGMTYPEICKYMLSNSSTVRVFNTQQKAPYLYNEDDWVTYEDTESIAEKAKWAQGNGLAGMMFWSIDQDDFSGKACNKGRFPLLKTVKQLTESQTTTETPRSNDVTTTSGQTVTDCSLLLVIYVSICSILIMHSHSSILVSSCN